MSNVNADDNEAYHQRKKPHEFNRISMGKLKQFMRKMVNTISTKESLLIVL